MTPAADAALRKARWKSRRGLLELDCVLARFWEKRGGELNGEELRALNELLLLDDDALWTLVKNPPDDGGGVAGGLSPTARQLAGLLGAL